jgi:hypothetical protein
VRPCRNHGHLGPRPSVLVKGGTHDLSHADEPDRTSRATGDDLARSG